ncbi:MAG: hypothetical protein ACYTGH_16275 [Planctomycetota bacterium]
MAFWNNCARAEEMLAEEMSRPTHISADGLVKRFTSPWPEGLNKDGVRFHPDLDGNYPADPEVVRY